jgi:hypothetical protein
MILLLRALVRVLAFVLLLALALAGLAAAVFSIQGGTETLSYNELASLVGLPEARDAISGWFGQIAADGPIAVVALLCGLGAILLGLLLIAGVLVPRRERLIALEQREDGTLAARRRPLASVARTLTEQARGVTQAKVRARPRRRSGGILTVRADRTRQTDEAAARSAVEAELEPLVGPFDLRTRVASRVGEAGSRVQ